MSDGNGRGPGRPKYRDGMVCTPEVLSTISDMWCRGESYHAIGKVIGCNHSTVRHAIRSKILPQWKAEMVSTLETELAKWGHLERVCWQQFDKSDRAVPRAVAVRAAKKCGLSKEQAESLTRLKSGRKSIVWMELVFKIIAERAKILGYYAPQRHEIEHAGQIRLAGQSPTEFDAETVRLLMEKIRERREAQAAVDLRLGDPGAN